MYKTFTVVVSKYSNGSSYELILEKTAAYTAAYDAEAVLALIDMGCSYMGIGKSVLIRPDFNEVDGNGNVYYREWLSVDGQPFKVRTFQTQCKALTHVVSEYLDRKNVLAGENGSTAESAQQRECRELANWLNSQVPRIR